MASVMATTILAPRRPAGGKCRAGNGSFGSYAGCDLYDLLGVENDAPQLEIKRAYRCLQKQCHPDVAGTIGHDMSILLNDAYSLLSDASRRSSYDKIREEWIQFDGYTGNPLFSSWLGSADEERAVFVDESRCVGCLKCALIAKNTFAIEKRFGRARAIAQWGDPEHMIEDAIRSCPVDCISWVDRKKIPALEYVMSKQTPLPVNVDAESYVGRRNVDVFRAADKFLKKKNEFEEKAKSGNPGQTCGAAEKIHPREHQWWNFFVGKSSSYLTVVNSEASLRGAIVQVPKPFFPSGRLRALYEAAARRRLGVPRTKAWSPLQTDEYWVPSETVPGAVEFQEKNPSHSDLKPREEANSRMGLQEEKARGYSSRTVSEQELLLTSVPPLASLVSSLVVVLGDRSINMANSSSSSVSTSDVSGPLLKLSQNFMIEELSSNLAVRALLASVAWFTITTLICRGLLVVLASKADREH